MKISIITINYNNKVGLEQTIKSVVAQTYKNIEYIVIDGGSDDGSKEILERYKGRLAYAISEPDKGIYNAMNKGINVATGDYLIFINSGDFLANSSAIENAVNSSFDADLIAGNLRYFNDNGKRDWLPSKSFTFDSFQTTGLPHPSTFIKRRLFDLIGIYDERLTIVSDWKFFMIAICKYNCSYKHIDVLISEFNEDGISSRSDNLPKILSEREQVLNEDFKSFLPDYEELWLARKQLHKLRYTIKIKKFLGIR